MKRPSWHKMVEQRGDKWSACRYEGPTMRVFVGNYDYEWEANQAAEIAQADWDEWNELTKERKKKLSDKINSALDKISKKDDLPRTRPPQDKRSMRPKDAYKNAKRIVKK